MASTSGSSEMILKKFDGTNFSYCKERMQDYMIVKGPIDLLENATVLEMAVVLRLHAMSIQRQINNRLSTN